MKNVNNEKYSEDKFIKFLNFIKNIIDEIYG